MKGKILRKVLFRVLRKLGKNLAWLFPVKEVRSRKEKGVFEAIWYQVWLEEKYTCLEEPILAKYAKYDKSSTDLLCMFLGILPIGTIRLIWEGFPSLPILNDFEVKKIWKGQIVEFTLFTIKREWRGFGHFPSLMLMREGYRRAKRAGIEGIVIITEENLFKLLAKRLGLPFQSIGATKFYEGGLCFPAYMSIKKAERILPKSRPDLYNFFTS